MPLRQVGEATAQALFERIGKPDEAPRRVKLRPTLRARESSAPPA
jgi:DNA-binding LacI/PurR family transcriptional regulator